MNVDFKSWFNTASVFMVFGIIILVVALWFGIVWVNQSLWNYALGARVTTFGYWEMMAITFLAIEFGSMFKK